MNKENVRLLLDSAGDLVAANTDQAEVLSAAFVSVFTSKVSQALGFAAGLKEEESDQHCI